MEQPSALRGLSDRYALFRQVGEGDLQELFATEAEMSGRRSVATEKALKLVEKGLTPYAAAKKVGIALSTIYRALAKKKLATIDA